MQKKISIFSFFAGIGILDLAFEKSGYNIVFVNEYDDLFMASYQYARTQMTHLVPLYGYHNDSAERYAKKRGKRKLINLVAKRKRKRKFGRFHWRSSLPRLFGCGEKCWCCWRKWSIN